MNQSHTDTPGVTRASLTALLLLTALCGLTVATGVSQQWFEWVHAPDAYALRLVHDAFWLRVIIAIDDGFIAAYVTATVLLASRLSSGRPSPLSVLIMAGGVAAGVLDLDENHHILSLLRVAEMGLPIALSDVLHRSELSQLKWMLAHLSFVFVGVALPRRGPASVRVLRITLLAGQLPIGALCWAVSSPTWQPIVQWARYLSFLAGFASIAALTFRPAHGAGLGVDGEADSSAPA